MSNLNKIRKEDECFILFSGGWDSTFRLLQLASIDGLTIRPIYLVDKNRLGHVYELKAMNSILKEIGKKSIRFPATIKPLEKIDVEKLMQESDVEEIIKAYNTLAEKYELGVQYQWFAVLAQKRGVLFETGILNDSERSKVRDAIYGEGGKIVSAASNLVLDRKVLLIEDEESVIARIFGRLAISMDGLSKLDEMRLAEEYGWLTIMNLTWFCHTPMYGKPCGLCGPCKDAMNEGMEWRLPPIAKWRYKHQRNIFVRIKIPIYSG